ncbi:hypothetical protein LINGRAPRIM_LOCUS2981 [Linum grandiflorum]
MPEEHRLRLQWHRRSCPKTRSLWPLFSSRTQLPPITLSPPTNTCFL